MLIKRSSKLPLRILRAKVLAAALAVGLVTTVSACGSSSSEQASDGNGAVTVILNNNPAGNPIAALVEQYTKETGAQVTVQSFAEQQMRDKIQLNLQSKSSAMDVYMTLPSREGPLFEASGYYEPLDSYLSAADASYKIADFSSAVLGGMKVADATVAAPMNIEGPVMYYRKDVLKEYGIAVPKTIDELIEACKTIKDRSGGSIVPITLRGATDALTYDFGAFFHAGGLTWTTDGIPNFDKPEAVNAIRQYSILAGQYGPPGVVNYSFNESSTLFASGGAAFELESSSQFNAVTDPVKSKVADNVGIANIPGGASGSTPTSLSWGLAMSPFSANKAAAWKFIQWATSPETQLAAAKAGSTPPRTSVLTDPSYVATYKTDAGTDLLAALKYIVEKGDTEVGPVGNKAPAIRTAIGQAMQKAILGKSTPEEAAAEIQAAITPLLQDQKK